MSWLSDIFGTEKPIIGMCHLHALPGDPGFGHAGSMDSIIEAARTDLCALQEGGVDAVMFSNEASRPYLTKVETVTVACMARLIGELRPEIHVPYGVNVLWDAEASIDLAVATGASFVREVFTGAYASDFGLWNTDCGAVVRHQHAIGGERVRLIFNIYPESAMYLAPRKLSELAVSTVFNALPDAVCVSGLTAGVPTDATLLAQVKRALPGVPAFANTGVRPDNVAEQLSVADGAIVGTCLKHDGNTWNPVDVRRVQEFMAAVRSARSQADGAV